MKKNEIDLKTISILVNDFSAKNKLFKRVIFIEKLKEIPYASFLIAFLVKNGLCEKKDNGYYSIPNPIYINTFELFLKEMREYYKMKDKNRVRYNKKAINCKNFFIKSVVDDLTIEGYKVEGELRELSEKEKIDILKRLGFVIYKKV